MENYPLEIVILVFILAFIMGGLVGIFFTIMSSSRISKKDADDFKFFLSQREQKRKYLKAQAKDLENNY
jgi:CBS domain containing-hemolysin-like protein